MWERIGFPFLFLWHLNLKKTLSATRQDSITIDTGLLWLCAFEKYLQHVQHRVTNWNNITGSMAKPDNNKCPCDMACEGELGTACYKYSAGTGYAQSLMVCFLFSTTAADVSPGQRSHDPLLLSTTPSQRIKPWSGYPGSPAPVSPGKRYTLQGAHHLS